MAGLRWRFALLGVPEVMTDQERLPAMSPTQTALLAALALQAGRSVGVDELIDGLYGDSPTRSAGSMITTYVLRLRKVLGPELIVRVGGGYALNVPRTAVDALEFERLAGAPLLGDAAVDAVRLQAALGLWHGTTALVGAIGPLCERRREVLAQHRERARLQWFECQLVLGRHAEILADLAAACELTPFAERLQALRMTALFRCGRQAEALEVFHRVRGLLAQELGIDPSADLAAVQQAILRGCDPQPRSAPVGIEVFGGAETGTPPPGQLPCPPSQLPSPRQLPSPPADLVGREEEIARLASAVRAGGHAVGLVTGMGGVGKSTVVVSAAHAIAADFPDGQLWACLRGSTEAPVGAGEVLAGFLTALGAPAERVPGGVAERAALYRSALAGRSVLVVLDDVGDATEFSRLLPGTAGCAVLISARTRPAIGVSAAVRLEGLRPAESARLVCAILGAERAGAEPAAVAALTAACGELPLAVRALATRLARRPAWTVASLAARLSDEAFLLGELEAGGAGLAEAFDRVFGRLTGSQAQALHALAVTRSRDWSLSAAAAALDLPEAQAERILEALVDAALLTSPGPCHYSCHHLVIAYARAWARTDRQT
ncbi:AfsR/SARP family transcriptional regulator [Kitasatospora kifunensis]|uniref:DNA-binding SARP family transcriptional activator n=1 Tax=Kitasatospora kifunensis TaxID=58351 RepID=A0A7W7QY41_KITKI|nr:BTAD domain-containing putative transcriptional regulator [Kitasatospora kifunensis]MBB4921966.1 DNA-binding SARP family transcriptional activator [Kitasatospora kifunensis]